MRTDSTCAEDMLWKRLRNRQLVGMKFRRQHPLGPYIVDFYCHEASLAIELDGRGHQDTDRADYDQIRSMELEGMGVKVIRFWHQEVMDNLEGVLEVIKGALTLALSQRERGRKDCSEQLPCMLGCRRDRESFRGTSHFLLPSEEGHRVRVSVLRTCLFHTAFKQRVVQESQALSNPASGHQRPLFLIEDNRALAAKRILFFSLAR